MSCVVQGDVFIADVVKAFETYNVDVMGITETGSREHYGSSFKEKVIAGLEKKGLYCIWALPDPYERNLGVMLVHRKGIRVKEVLVEESSSGRVLAAELTTRDSVLSKEVKTVVGIEKVEVNFQQLACSMSSPGNCLVKSGKILQETQNFFSSLIL